MGIFVHLTTASSIPFLLAPSITPTHTHSLLFLSYLGAMSEFDDVQLSVSLHQVSLDCFVCFW